MKQHTTQTKTLRVPGQENVLAIADRVVLVAKSAKGEQIAWEGERLTIEGDSVTWSMTTEETAALVGTSVVELTIFANGEVLKTEDRHMTIKPSVWNNVDGVDDE